MPYHRTPADVMLIHKTASWGYKKDSEHSSDDVTVFIILACNYMSWPLDSSHQLALHIRAKLSQDTRAITNKQPVRIDFALATFLYILSCIATSKREIFARWYLKRNKCNINNFYYYFIKRYSWLLDFLSVTINSLIYLIIYHKNVQYVHLMMALVV